MSRSNALSHTHTSHSLYLTHTSHFHTPSHTLSHVHTSHTLTRTHHILFHTTYCTYIYIYHTHSISMRTHHTLPLSLFSSHTLHLLLSSVDMSRDALHEAVFGMLEQYQEEPVPYAYHSQEPPPYMHPNQEPGPPGYTSCDEVPNGMAFPYQIAATNNTGLVTPGNQTTPSQSTVNVPARSGHRPVSASWNSVPFDGRFTEMSRITIGELLRQGVCVCGWVGGCVWVCLGGCQCGCGCWRVSRNMV